MPRALSSALRDLVKADFQNGVDIEIIKDTYKISDKKAREMKKLFDKIGEVHRLEAKKKGTGRPKKFLPEHEERLRQFLDEHPDAYLRDMCTYMEKECNMHTTETTLQRTCKRIGWKLQPKVQQRDESGFWTRTLPREDNDNTIRSARKEIKRKEKEEREKSGVMKMSYNTRKKLLEKTRAFVKGAMSQPQFDAGRDYDHALRVVALSLEVLRVEQNTHREVAFSSLIVELVALMHDVEDLSYNSAMNIQSSSYPSPPFAVTPSQMTSATQLQPLTHPPNPSNIDPTLSNLPARPSITERHLLDLGWPPHFASKVGAITPFISYASETGNPAGHASALAQHPELAIVQDADRLDSIGATGISRAFTHGGTMGSDGRIIDTMTHIGGELVKLETLMKTEEGRRLAAVRAERLRIFGGWLAEEMKIVGVRDFADMAWVESPLRRVGQATASAAGGVDQWTTGETQPLARLEENPSILEGTQEPAESGILEGIQDAGTS